MACGGGSTTRSAKTSPSSARTGASSGACRASTATGPTSRTARWRGPDRPVTRLAFALLALTLSPASAQETRGGPAGDFSFYVLALTWSPGFCELEGERKQRRQCEPGRELGFTM